MNLLRFIGDHTFLVVLIIFKVQTEPKIPILNKNLSMTPRSEINAGGDI